MKKQTKKNRQKTPFYAHLLSKQEMQRAAAGQLQATKPWLDEPQQTQKWPSDGDESTPLNDNID